MFVDCADGCDEAGIKKRLYAGTEFRGGLFGGASDIRLQGAATRFDCGAILRIQRGERRTGALGGFGEDVVGLRFDAATEIIDGAVGGFLQERASFTGAGFEFQRDFLRDHLLLFHQANELAVGNTGGDRFEFLGGMTDGLLDGSKIQRAKLARGAFGKLASFIQAIAGFRGKFFELLGELVGASLSLGDKSLVMSGNLAETPFEMAEYVVAG